MRNVRRRFKMLAFGGLIIAALVTTESPTAAVNGACVTMQPFCESILQIDYAGPDCGGPGTWENWDYCENCGWDWDHCCATWTCIG